MRSILILLSLTLLACSDTPLSSGAGACDPAAARLAAEWQREHRDRSGHTYRESLIFSEVKPCQYSYYFSATQTDSGHAGLVYKSAGDLFVVAVEQRGPVAYLATESRRILSAHYDAEGLVQQRDSTATLLEPATARLWGDNLSFWGKQYARVK